MMDCIFCKIVEGQIPCKKIYENNSVLAFLDINPANPGHTILIPKRHSENIYDIDNNSLEEVIVAAKLIASRIKEKLDADGVNILQNNEKVAGQIVNHVHIHIIPRFKRDKVVIDYPRNEMPEAEMEDIRKKLSLESKSVEIKPVPEPARPEPVAEKPTRKKKMSQKELREWAFDEEF